MKSYSRILVAFILSVILMLPISIFGVSVQAYSDGALRTGYHDNLYTNIIFNDGKNGSVNDITFYNPNLIIGLGNGTPLLISRDDVAQTFSIAPNVNGLQAGLIIPLTAQDYGLSVLGTLKTNDINASASTVYASTLISSFANLNSLFVGSGSGVLMSVDGSAQTFSIAPLSYGGAGLTMPLTAQGYGLSVLGTLRTKDVSVSGSLTATGNIDVSGSLSANSISANSISSSTISADSISAGTITINGTITAHQLCFDGGDCRTSWPATPPPTTYQYYYLDADKDNYAVTGSGINASTNPNPDKYSTASQLWSTYGDCDDANNDVNPGAGYYRVSYSGNGNSNNWDYNCDGKVTYQLDDVASCSQATNSKGATVYLRTGTTEYACTGNSGGVLMIKKNKGEIPICYYLNSYDCNYVPSSSQTFAPSLTRVAARH